MELSFVDVLFSVLTLVVLIIPGFILVKTKMLGEGSAKAFSTFLLYACQPMLIFNSFQCEYDSKLVINMLVVALMAALVHFIMLGIVWLIFRKKSQDAKIKVVKFASVFGNCGFMGIPFLKTLFSSVAGGALVDEIIIYAAAVIAVFNLIAWTFGIFVMTGDKKYVSVKKAVINPATLAILVAVPVFLLVKQPIATLDTGVNEINMLFESLMKCVTFLAEMVTPIAMTVLGMRLANVKFKELFTYWGMYASSALKLVIAPLVAMGVVAICKLIFKMDFLTMEYTLFFTMAMPTATSTILFTEQFGGETKTATQTMLFSTILSILTIPLTFLLFKAAFGL